jgi:hypothetical protein
MELCKDFCPLLLFEPGKLTLRAVRLGQGVVSPLQGFEPNRENPGLQSSLPSPWAAVSRPVGPSRFAASEWKVES